MADYLEAYARRFLLPVRNGVRVDGLSRSGDRYLIVAGAQRFLAARGRGGDGDLPEAEGSRPSQGSWMRASSSCTRATTGGRLSSGREGAARRSGQLGRGDRDRAPQAGHPVVMSGRDVGNVPPWFHDPISSGCSCRCCSGASSTALLTESTPLGRKAKRGHNGQATPLIRTLPRHLAAAGVDRVGRVSRREGRPAGARGRHGARREERHLVHRVPPRFLLGDLPVFDEHGEPRQYRGVVCRVTGSLLRRAGFPVRDVLHDDPRCWSGRAVRRPARRRTTRDRAPARDVFRSLRARSTRPHHDEPAARADRLEN